MMKFLDLTISIVFCSHVLAITHVNGTAITRLLNNILFPIKNYVKCLNEEYFNGLNAVI
jgi:hypothetical protein